jgi:hypothetical protein
LAVLSFRGFRGRENRNMWNSPSLWERGTRNEESVILKKEAT